MERSEELNHLFMPPLFFVRDSIQTTKAVEDIQTCFKKSYQHTGSPTTIDAKEPGKYFFFSKVFGLFLITNLSFVQNQDRKKKRKKKENSAYKTKQTKGLIIQYKLQTNNVVRMRRLEVNRPTFPMATNACNESQGEGKRKRIRRT
jgi:hypothetical protein